MKESCMAGMHTHKRGGGAVRGGGAKAKPVPPPNFLKNIFFPFSFFSKISQRVEMRISHSCPV
jgi:hypothetical protein